MAPTPTPPSTPAHNPTAPQRHPTEPSPTNPPTKPGESSVVSSTHSPENDEAGEAKGLHRVETPFPKDRTTSRRLELPNSCEVTSDVVGPDR
jgi:hypothetical protein